MEEQEPHRSELRPIIVQLVFLLAVLALAASGFALLADEVREGDTLTVDENILNAVFQTSAPFFDRLFHFIAYLGDTVVVAVASALLCIGLYLKRYFYRSLFIALAMGGIGLLIVFLKLVFARPRPELWQQIVTETSYSFPSGHATASSAIAICLTMIFWRSKWRYVVLALSIMYVVLVGYSRLYLGVHYPSDVIGGWALSALWLAAVGLVLNSHVLHRSLRLSKRK
jgi:membrane-associated phospholipid phosphatase